MMRSAVNKKDEDSEVGKALGRGEAGRIAGPGIYVWRTYLRHS